jgi:hypothetical protein
MSDKWLEERRQRGEYREAQKAKVEQAITKGEELGKSISDTLQGYYKDLGDQAQALVDAKHELLCTPRTRAEFGQLAKAELKRVRKELVVDNLLYKHFEETHLANGYPFPDVGMRISWGADSNMWKAWLSVFSEDDIDDVCARLPEIGISEAERAERIAEIDQKLEDINKKLVGPPPKNLISGK